MRHQDFDAHSTHGPRTAAAAGPASARRVASKYAEPQAFAPAFPGFLPLWLNRRQRKRPVDVKEIEQSARPGPDSDPGGLVACAGGLAAQL